MANGEKSLETTLREARDQTQELQSLLAEAKAGQEDLHVFIMEHLKMVKTLLRDNMIVNIDLRNKSTDETEREMRRELDELYRQQSDIIDQLLAFPSRST